MQRASHARLRAVPLPAFLDRLVPQGTAAPVLRSAKERPMGIPGSLQVRAYVLHKARIVQQHGAPLVAFATTTMVLATAPDSTEIALNAKAVNGQIEVALRQSR